MARPERRRPGRRPGRPDVRTEILDAARRAFAERGFRSATIRAIAADADVDPALVIHYFRNKADLFAAAIRLPIMPTDTLASLREVGREHLGEAVLRLALGVWDDPEARAVWLGLIRSAVADVDTADVFREFLTSVLMAQVGDLVDQPDAAYRVSLVGSQLVGLGIARHVLRVEPAASASTESLVAAVAPTLQRYLTGDITADDPAT